MSQQPPVNPTPQDELLARVTQHSSKIVGKLLAYAFLFALMALLLLPPVRSEMEAALNHITLRIAFPGDAVSKEQKEFLIAEATKARDRYRQAAKYETEQMEIRNEICFENGHNTLSAQVASDKELFEVALENCSVTHLRDRVGSGVQLGQTADTLDEIIRKLERVSRITEEERQLVADSTRKSKETHDLVTSYWFAFTSMKKGAEKVKARHAYGVEGKLGREIKRLTILTQELGEEFAELQKEYDEKRKLWEDLDARWNALDSEVKELRKVVPVRETGGVTAASFFRETDSRAYENEKALREKEFELEKLSEEWDSGIEPFEKLENRYRAKQERLNSLTERLERLKAVSLK